MWPLQIKISSRFCLFFKGKGCGAGRTVFKPGPSRALSAGAGRAGAQGQPWPQGLEGVLPQSKIKTAPPLLRGGSQMWCCEPIITAPGKTGRELEVLLSYMVRPSVKKSDSEGS